MDFGLNSFPNIVALLSLLCILPLTIACLFQACSGRGWIYFVRTWSYMAGMVLEKLITKKSTVRLRALFHNKKLILTLPKTMYEYTKNAVPILFQARNNRTLLIIPYFVVYIQCFSISWTSTIMLIQNAICQFIIYFFKGR